MTPKAPSKQNRKIPGKGTTTQSAEIEKHLPRMRQIHPELRQMVNDFLQEKQIPLKVDAMHFTTNIASSDSNCCTINGMVVCGPQCG